MAGTLSRRVSAGIGCLLFGGAALGAGVSVRPLTDGHRVWVMSEFRLEGLPGAANPFDPDEIAVDVEVRGPEGASSVVLPAFYFRDYDRALVRDGDRDVERLTGRGHGEWRLRFTPVREGVHTFRVSVSLGAKPAERVAEGSFRVGSAPAGARGFVRVEPTRKRFFMYDDGTPLPLLGECCCWHGSRGTYDYDDWFADYPEAGMNYTRLWMWPNAFGIEVLDGERTRYNQERAWQLDRVLSLAAEKGISVMLCLDYHGVFQVDPDMWGGNNFWPQHPYNVRTGGPCETQNDFFTDEQAAALYRKRLRYLIARYSAMPSLMSWQFFNEINNVYRYLKPADVVAWHDRMARWIKGNDPYRHPITTSFGSRGEQADMWRLESLDYCQWHLYLNWAGEYRHPAPMAADVARRFARDYGKPVYVGEYGTDGRGWRPESDPHFRGLQQALWGGMLAGTAGTAMPWWWEGMHRDKLHVKLWKPLAGFLEGTGFGSAAWGPVEVAAAGLLQRLGAPRPGGEPFAVTIPFTGKWGDRLAGEVALTDPGAADGAPLHVFLHGSSKSDLAVPCRIAAVLGDGARLTVHVNSASTDARLEVRQSGRVILARPFPNKDGTYEVNGEYDEDVTVDLAPGTHVVELANPGSDWLNIDWVRVEGALPTAPGGRDLSPAVMPYVMSDGLRALAWILDPRYNYPNRAKDDAESLAGAEVSIPGLPDGSYAVSWWDTRRGEVYSRGRVESAGGRLVLVVPEFSVDTAVRVMPAE